jgi:hypothetical protein
MMEVVNVCIGGFVAVVAIVVAVMYTALIVNKRAERTAIRAFRTYRKHILKERKHGTCE